MCVSQSVSVLSITVVGKSHTHTHKYCEQDEREREKEREGGREEFARPFAVYHMESNTRLFMAPWMTQQSAETESLPLFINFMAVVVSSGGREIIAPIYLKVVGLKREEEEDSAGDRQGS